MLSSNSDIERVKQESGASSQIPLETHPAPVLAFPPGTDAFLEDLLSSERIFLSEESKILDEEREHEAIKSKRLKLLHSQRARRAQQNAADNSSELVMKDMLEKLGDAIRDREASLRSDGYQTFLFSNEDLYEGNWKNSVMHGRGVMRSQEGTQIYEGEWFLGTRNGQGTLFSATTDTIYEGKWSEGKRHGKGEQTEPEGVYKGDFKEGKMQGSGEYVYNDGHVYRGEWQDELYHGTGVYLFPTGTKYDGAWRAGQQHGRGTKVYRNGDVYSGEWQYGRRHGIGNFSSTFFTYEGQWLYDQIEGKGSCHFSDGSSYCGQWAKGKFHGEGTLTDKHGSTYSGSFWFGKRHGEGTYVGNGVSYTGPWEHDKKVGAEGSMAFVSGGVYTGPWKNNQPHGRGYFDTTTGVRDVVVYSNGLCVERDDSVKFKKFNAELEINMIISPEAERKSRFATKKRKEAIEQQRLLQMQQTPASSPLGASLKTFQ